MGKHNSELIAQPDSDTEPYDSECPECGSTNVYRDSMFDVSELSSVAPVCNDCEHSWFESA